MNKESSQKKSNEPSESQIKDYRDIVGFSKSEIEWVRKAYTWLVTLIAIVSTVGIVFTYKSANDFKDETRKQMTDRLTALESQMTATLGKQLREMQIAVKKRVDKEFKTKNIHTLVEKEAKSRIDEIAKPLIQENISKNIEPQIHQVEGDLGGIRSEIGRVKAMIAGVESLSDFNTTVVSAKNDDRKAFDRLEEWSKNLNYPYQKQAESEWNAIIEKHSPLFEKSTAEGGYELSYLHKNITDGMWAKQMDQSGKSIDDLKKEFESVPVSDRPRVLEYIFQRNDFPKKQKMEFLVHVLESDPSVNVTAKAGRLFCEESKQTLKPLLVSEMLQWWKNHKNQFEEPQIKNQ